MIAVSPCKVLFLCTGNSARSILFAATLNHFGAGRFVAFSAGSQPLGRVNPFALQELARRGIATDGARSKSWDEFCGPEAPALDIVVTVCDSAAQETCPVFFGDFVSVHWGLPDPSHVSGGDAALAEAFRRTETLVVAHIAALLEIPLATLDRPALKRGLDELHRRLPAVALAD